MLQPWIVVANQLEWIKRDVGVSTVWTDQAVSRLTQGLHKGLDCSSTYAVTAAYIFASQYSNRLLRFLRCSDLRAVTISLAAHNMTFPLLDMPRISVHGQFAVELQSHIDSCISISWQGCDPPSKKMNQPYRHGSYRWFLLSDIGCICLYHV